MQKGFTLIELLVVVLIIGILVAIALPQYKTAVLKSKTVPLLTIMRTVMSAEEEYILSGANATKSHIIADLDALAIDLSGYTKQCQSEQYEGYQKCFYKKGDIGFTVGEASSQIIAWVFDRDGKEILSMNMLSSHMCRNNNYSEWYDKSACVLCEYPSTSAQLSAAASVCKSICGGSPTYERGNGKYRTCFFN